MSAPWVETPEPAIDRTFSHIGRAWPELTRPGSWLAFPLPNPYVRPGGFFKMFVYWDSYFVLLGLVVQGEWELASGTWTTWSTPSSGSDTFRATSLQRRFAAPVRSRHTSLPPSPRSCPTGRTAGGWNERWALPSTSTRGTGAPSRTSPRWDSVGTWTMGRTGAPRCRTPRTTAPSPRAAGTSPLVRHRCHPGRAVDLNAQLYWYEQNLAEFSEMLGRTERAAAWRERAAGSP